MRNTGKPVQCYIKPSAKMSTSANHLYASGSRLPIAKNGGHQWVGEGGLKSATILDELNRDWAFSQIEC